MRKKCLVLFVTLGLFVLAGFAQAADDAKSETDETETVTMEEVVVTATKTDEKRKDIPNSVIIKDSYDIKESPAKTLGEFLSNETGVDLRTYGNYGGAAEELQIRGMSSNGTQIFVNGLNVNSPSLSTADIGRIPLNSIERIEVVKGSGSLLYGSGAMGGTVNIITKRPERDKMDLKARAGYGSENTYEVSAEQGMFALGNFGYYLTATQRETDGFRDNSDLTHNDISGNLILDKGDILDISIYGDYIDREYGVPLVTPPGGTQPFVSNGVVIYNEESASLVNKGADKDSHLVLNIKSKPSDLLGIMLRGDLTNLENFNENHYSGLTGTKAWVRNKVIEGTTLVAPCTWNVPAPETTAPPTVTMLRPPSTVNMLALPLDSTLKLTSCEFSLIIIWVFCIFIRLCRTPSAITLMSKRPSSSPAVTLSAIVPMVANVVRALPASSWSKFN